MLKSLRIPSDALKCEKLFYEENAQQIFYDASQLPVALSLRPIARNKKRASREDEIATRKAAWNKFS
jgi:hypothetical protein